MPMHVLLHYFSLSYWKSTALIFSYSLNNFDHESGGSQKRNKKNDRQWNIIKKIQGSF
ncbi:MAG: hypothetical protein K0R59_528 [Sphingobacterium sp.]|jgi:hypothetical protein|nr:hypothetical protein [Sphingobacterium sp.]